MNAKDNRFYRTTPALRLRRTSEPDTHEKLERFKRWPSLLQKWNDKKVRIWSGEHDSYWRADGAGYTCDGLEAGVYVFQDAYNRTNHCDPSKRIEFKAV